MPDTTPRPWLLRHGAACALSLGVITAGCRPSRCVPEPARATHALPDGGGQAALGFRQFDVKIAVDLDTRAITGETTVSFDFRAAGAREIAFTANDLVLDSVTLDGRAVSHHRAAQNLIVALPARLTSPERLTFRYHGAPSRGLVFGESLVYSDYFTCSWMICRDEPGDKASLRLEVEAPAQLQVVASGRQVGHAAVAGNRARWTFSEERAYSPYLFGFAAGEFGQAVASAGPTKLQFFGASETPESLLAKLRDTARIMRFFEDKAGVPFPHDVYTQVVVPGSEAQEKSSFSLLGKENLDAILDNPEEDWVIVHELAHQWWGNLVTCQSWAHFWLNEGMTSFMVAAYKEHRWGKAAYDREIALFRERRQRAAAASFDVPLAYSKPYPSLRIKRAITYAKGALFLHTLRDQIGEGAFWSGVKHYTQEHAGKVVESRDLRRAMESASGKDLAPLFRAWVGDDA